MKNEISRRGFLKGSLLSTALITTGVLFSSKLKADESLKLKNVAKTKELEGNIFYLNIGKSIVNFSGSPAIATTVNNMYPAPTLIWREGEEVTIYVTNNLNEDTSLHWHGIILPNNMDGVPKLTFDGIKPGETFTYKFKVKQSGVYWYHSHSGLQEQSGIHGAIVIKPKEKEPYEYDRDYLIELSDWTDEDPKSVYRKLKIHSEYYGMNNRKIGDFFDEVKEKGFSRAFSDRKMWNRMRMSNRDLSDVTGMTYKYLINSYRAEDKHTFLFQRGERIRLRFINSSAMTFFDIRIPKLKMKIVASDGNYVKPVEVDEFRIGVAETYDVIVEPQDNQAYAIFAQSLDRTGYALVHLTQNRDTLAKIPKMDPLPTLEMIDMGMDMSKMNRMNMSGMSNSSGNFTLPDELFKLEREIPITPLEFESGPQMAMKIRKPKYRLNDPGSGLRNNGRKSLTYTDLETIGNTDKDIYPDREIILHLTGNMGRYMWSINGIPYSRAKPLRFNYGERLRITFINDTMMNHPMHLHGLWSDVELGNNRFLRKHTVIVQPGSKVSVRVTVNAKGNWAFHCHLLYHMFDMFRKVVVA